jgi:hypothetical protein
MKKILERDDCFYTPLPPFQLQCVPDNSRKSNLASQAEVDAHEYWLIQLICPMASAFGLSNTAMVARMHISTSQQVIS